MGKTSNDSRNNQDIIPLIWVSNEPIPEELSHFQRVPFDIQSQNSTLPSLPEGVVVFEMSLAKKILLPELVRRNSQLEFVILDKDPSEEKIISLVNDYNVAGIFSSIGEQRVDFLHLFDRLWIKALARRTKRLEGEERLLKNKNIEALTDVLEKKILERTSHIEASMKEEREKLNKERSIIRFINEVALLESVEELMIFLKREFKKFHQIQTISALVEGEIYTFQNQKIVRRTVMDDYDWNLTPRQGNHEVRQIIANALGRPISKGLYWQHFNGLIILEYSFFDNEGLAAMTEFMDERIQVISMFIERVIHESDASVVSRRWERIFNSFKDPILIVDQEFNIVRANRAFGPSLNGKCYQVFSGSSQPCVGCPLVDKDSAQMERKDKSFSVHSWAVENSGKHFVHHYSDISISRELKMRLLQNQKMVAIGDLADNLAHELNNPLSGIKSLANILVQENSADSQLSADLRQIEQGAGRCLTTIQHFVSFAKNENHGVQLCSLDEIVKSTLPILKSVMRGHRQGLALAAGQARVLVNPHLMQQVVFNLVQNSCQAMPEAGSISIATKAQNNSVFLIVKDSGPGIPPEIQSKIFDPFFTTKPDGSGTGLGLSTSKSIVERFGGKIDFTSSKEQGTSFVISFTAEEVAR